MSKIVSPVLTGADGVEHPLICTQCGSNTFTCPKVALRPSGLVILPQDYICTNCGRMETIAYSSRRVRLIVGFTMSLFVVSSVIVGYLVYAG